MISPPSFITFTGLDNRTDLKRCRELQELYPIEWGVLFRLWADDGSAQRFPQLQTMIAIRDSDLQHLSLHFCGASARELNQYASPGMMPMGWPRYTRFQVNTENVDPLKVAFFARGHEVGAIGQLWEATWPRDNAIDWLFDQSAGAGVVPDKWPKHPGGGRFVGYAGGMGPHNVEACLEAIGVTDPHDLYWIDMEHHVRTDEWLDLDKCEAVCEAVYGKR